MTPTTTTSSSMRSHRYLLAGAMVATPLLLLAGSVLEIDTGDDAGAATLAAVAADRDQFYAAGLLLALGLAALGACGVGLMQLTRTRGGTLTTIGGALLMLAGPAAGAGIFMYTAVLYTASSPDLDRPTMSAFDVAASDSVAVGIPFMIGFVGIALGLLLCGIGLAVGRAVPLWMAGVLAISGVLSWFSDGQASILLTTSAFLVLIGLAVELVRQQPRTVVLPDVPGQRTQAGMPAERADAEQVG
jgi:hypothetical protein